jgi:Rrf2 family protein
MVFLAAHPRAGVSTKRIASELHVSEAHLSKVLQRLAKAGLVDSTRGPKGGFRLAREAEDVRLLELYETIEGPLMANNCLLGTRICKGEQCILGNLLETVDRQVREYLAATRLSELTGVYGSNRGLAGRSNGDA